MTDYGPGISAILLRIGDKQSVLIVMELANGARRFNEIKRDVSGISQRMLTLTLRGLERDGLAARKVYDSVPPKIEYSLTDRGRSLQAPVMALGAWAISNRDLIHAAQAAFDRCRAGGIRPLPRRRHSTAAAQAAFDGWRNGRSDLLYWS